jgi:glycosyltransferase involved in cell wall biosynthesis
MVVGPGPQTEGGITEVISRIVKVLQQRPDHVVTWVAMHRSGSGLQKIVASMKGIATAIFAMPGVDIVHIHSAAYVSFFRKSAVFWVARLWRRRIIWHLHTPNDDFCDFFGAQGISGKYGRYVLGKADRVVVLSESWRPLATRYVDDSRITVILNPIPDIDAGRSVEKSDGLVRVLYLAHLIQRKGYPNLIRAFVGVYRAYPHCKLVFAGSGETREALELCRELGIEDAVEFLGWIGEPERSNELRKADIFVLPSYQEGLPMGILEAMAFGLAVVTTPVGGIGDVVKDQVNGVLVAPGEVDELERALADLVRDSEKRARLGKQAEEDVRSFTPVNISYDWIELYKELAGRQPGGEVT